MNAAIEVHRAKSFDFVKLEPIELCGLMFIYFLP